MRPAFQYPKTIAATVHRVSSPRSRLNHLSRHFASHTFNMSPPFAIIAGVGPGTGAAVARKFAKKSVISSPNPVLHPDQPGLTARPPRYPVVLLARNPSNYEPLVAEIEKSGGKAVGISADVSSPQSIDAAFKKIKGMGDEVAAGVYNVGGRFVRGPFLEMSLEDFQAGYEANG